jgi:hypothetical protein
MPILPCLRRKREMAALMIEESNSTSMYALVATHHGTELQVCPAMHFHAKKRPCIDATTQIFFDDGNVHQRQDSFFFFSFGL